MPKSFSLVSYLKSIWRTLPILIITIIAVPIVGMALSEWQKNVGLKTIPVPVVGTGSMYPSLFWAKSEGGPEDESKVVIEEYRTTPHLYRRYEGIKFAGHRYLVRSVGRGDLVAFKNQSTAAILSSESKDPSAGFIKRVIAIPGDVVELRDGFVYLNSSLLSEPYIAAPRSTYGGSRVGDCQKITLQPDQYFVLGDNRKVSLDSRFELGLITLADIEYVLPYSSQQIYHSLWRDPAKDQDLIGQSTLDPQEFITALNQLRSEKKLAPLRLIPKLVKSSQLRGQKILTSGEDSLSFQQAMSQSGYTNIALGEFVSHGNFSASELMSNLLYLNGTARQILDPNYQEIGVSGVHQNIDGCPTQVIVGHLGGYIPPSYDDKALASWQALSNNLSQILPSWEGAVGYNNLDQAKLAALINILKRRRDLSSEILDTMNKKIWLTKDQEARIKADDADSELADRLAKELNGN